MRILHKIFPGLFEGFQLGFSTVGGFKSAVAVAHESRILSEVLFEIVNGLLSIAVAKVFQDPEG